MLRYKSFKNSSKKYKDQIKSLHLNSTMTRSK